MTIVAWDGKTLCADKRATSSNLPVTVTKIFRIERGLIGFDGELTTGMMLLDWIRNGSLPEKYPQKQQDDGETYRLCLWERLRVKR